MVCSGKHSLTNIFLRCCSGCPLAGCQGNDVAGHILLECMHADIDMMKQHIARHDAMMITEFTKGAKGSHYLIADVGTVDTLKDLGVHSKRVPNFANCAARLSHPAHDTEHGTLQEPCDLQGR